MRIFLALLAVPALAAAASAHAQSPTALNLAGDGVNLAMSATASRPDQPEVATRAELTTDLQQLQTRLQFGLKTGSLAAAPGLAATGWWNSSAADLGAVWAPNARARLEFGAQNATRTEFDPSDPVYTDAAQRMSESRQSTASAAAVLTPFSPVAVRVGARMSSTLSQNRAVSGSGEVTSDFVQTDARQVFTELQWKPLPQLSLQGGGRVQSTGVFWSGARAGSYAELDPSAGVSLTPWDGAAWSLSLDRATAPLSTDQFVGYGQAAEVPALAGLQPNREWRYTAAFEQKAGPVDLTARLVQARLQTYAYMAPYAGAGARVGVGEGERREISAGLAAPLPVLGLQPFTLNLSGAWRVSAVQDPLTGALGRLSGERPYDASLTLSQALGSSGMRWGVTAQASGPQWSYLATQVTGLSATAGLGGFLQYRTRPITLQLTLNNILGGERSQRDVYYNGPRDLNVIDRVDQSRIVDRGVRISLVRPL